MADLFSLLSLGSNALMAQDQGVAVSSNNAANANTVGYSRETVDLQSLGDSQIVGGVIAGDPTRTSSALLNNRQRLALGSNGMSQAYAAASADLNTAASSGTTLDSQLASMFGAFDQVAASPQDMSLRTAAVNSAAAVAAGFQQRAAAIASTRSDADQTIKDDATQATQLAAQLASLNGSVATSTDPTLADKRDQAAQQLATLVGGTARVDPDGQMRVVLDGGGVLVDGTHAAQLTTTADPTTGYAQLQLVDGNTTRNVTGDIASGALGGELKLRDQTGAQAASDLDQLAYDTATSLDAVHSANAGLDGVTGRNLFVAPTGVAGAAAAMAIDPGVASDPSKLAAAAPGAGGGDATGMNALVAVADQKVADGGTSTLGDAAIDWAAGIGASAQQGQDDADRDSAVVTNLAALQTSLSGVDTNEELANLSKFQNAAGAMTKFISAVDSMLSDLITNLT